MFRRSLPGVSFLLLAAMLLVACGVSERPTAAVIVVVPATAPRPSPTPTPCVPSAVGSFPATLAPSDTLLSLDWEGGFTPQELSFPFGRVPEFTLLADGHAFYVDPPQWDKEQTMVARLTPAEAQALVQRVLDLGFECLESYTDQCRRLADDTSECVTDSGTSILRVRLPTGELRAIRNYASFANDPNVLTAIRGLLQDYTHPGAETYVPDKATLFVQPVPIPSGVPVLDWPLSPAWLTPLSAASQCERVLAGTDLQALLAVTGRNMGEFFFRHADADQVYKIYLTPWLPGVDYTDLIVSTGQPCPPVEVPKPTATPMPTAAARVALLPAPVPASAYRPPSMEEMEVHHAVGSPWTTCILREWRKEDKKTWYRSDRLRICSPRWCWWLR